MEWTLLLNSTYEPLRVVTWKKAVVMVMLGKVEVIEVYERVVRGVHISIQLPAVIRLYRLVRRRTPTVKFSRQNLYVRDKGVCQYCGHPFDPKELTYDHVLPRSRGGQTEWTNVVTCCLSCNLKKGGRTPEEAGMRLMKKPKAPIWIPLLTQCLGIEDPPPSWRHYLYLDQGRFV
ncbi:MAG: HNH endonuclease [Desulfobacterota bacterium]|nr:HNH endonuclease [Thermodesulfobacteriota bacterium]